MLFILNILLEEDIQITVAWSASTYRNQSVSV